MSDKEMSFPFYPRMGESKKDLEGNLFSENGIKKGKKFLKDGKEKHNKYYILVRYL